MRYLQGPQRRASVHESMLHFCVLGMLADSTRSGVPVVSFGSSASADTRHDLSGWVEARPFRGLPRREGATQCQKKLMLTGDSVPR